MKLTPEQKAFRDYGKALGRLEKFREEYRNRLARFSLYMRHYRRKHSKIYREEIILKHDELVGDAWQKRAVCRAWKATGGRSCYNCLYKNLPGSRRPCAMCEDVTHWKPRKEGE